MKSLLDRDFKYVPSGSTDLKKTFERVRREMEEKAKAKAKVCEIKPKGKAHV